MLQDLFNWFVQCGALCVASISQVPRPPKTGDWFTVVTIYYFSRWRANTKNMWHRTVQLSFIQIMVQRALNTFGWSCWVRSEAPGWASLPDFSFLLIICTDNIWQLTKHTQVDWYITTVYFTHQGRWDNKHLQNKWDFHTLGQHIVERNKRFHPRRNNLACIDHFYRGTSSLCPCRSCLLRGIHCFVVLGRWPPLGGGARATSGHTGQQWPGSRMGLLQSGRTQDSEEQSGIPSSQVQVTHASRFHVSPAL